MSIFAQSSGQRVPFLTRLNDTIPHAICKAAQQAVFTIESIYIANGPTAGVTLDLYINDSLNNNTYLLKAVAFAAHATTPITDQHIPLKPGWSLVAKANVGGTIDIITVAIQSNPTQATK